MKSRQLFDWVSVATLVFAHVVWQAHLSSGIDLRTMLLLAITYTICYYVRNLTYDEKTTFFDVDSRALPAEDDGLIIFGERVEDLSHESRERRLLTSLVDFTGQKYRLYFAWIASSAVVLFLQFRLTHTVSVEMLASFAIIAAIYFAPFLNQLLAPLFVAFAMALYGFGDSNQLKVTILFVIFLAMFAFVIVVFRDIARDRINPARRFSEKKRIRSAALLAGAAILIYGVLDYLIPQENPFQHNPPGVIASPKKLPRLSTDRLSREFAEQVVKFGEKNQDAKTGPTGSAEGRPDQGSQSDGKKTSDKPGGSPGGPSESGPSNGPGTAPSNAPSQGSGPGDGAAKGATDSPGRPNSAAGARDDGTDQPGNKNGNPETPDGSNGDTTATKASKGRGKHGEGTADGRADVEGKDRGIGNGTETGGTPGSPSSSPSEKTGAKPVPTGADQIAEAQKQHDKKVEDLQKDIKLPLDLAKGLIVLALAAAIVFTLFRYFSKKKPEEEVVRQQLSPKQRQKLQTLLQRIKARNLSPNDEIVETYNLLLTVFELGNHPREEWLPAEDFSNQISNSIPVLKTPFSSATQRFSQTLYGRRNVDETQLTTFREEVSKILQFFQLA